MAFLILSSVGWNSLIIAAGISRSIPCIDQWISLSPYFFIADSAWVPCSHSDDNNNRNKDQLSLGWANRTAYIQKPASDFQSRKITIFHSSNYTL